MNHTKISWTNLTWNPVHGCSRVSEGCRHCYAEVLSLRRGWTNLPWTSTNALVNVQLKPHKLQEPYKLKKPSRVFVNSMSDLFHEQVPDDYIAQVFGIMNDLPQHDFQILTKRPSRAEAWPGPWSPNIWMGTSVESNKELHRLQELRTCLAKRKFISFEPLIGPIGSDIALSGFDWVIVGGESGSGYRPMPHSWVRDIRDACIDQVVAFFFKQSAAHRNEVGGSLLHEDGEFYIWRQFPNDLRPPILSAAHKYSYGDSNDQV